MNITSLYNLHTENKQSYQRSTLHSQPLQAKNNGSVQLNNINSLSSDTVSFGATGKARFAPAGNNSKAATRMNNIKKIETSAFSDLKPTDFLPKNAALFSKYSPEALKNFELATDARIAEPRLPQYLYPPRNKALKVIKDYTASATELANLCKKARIHNQTSLTQEDGVRYEFRHLSAKTIVTKTTPRKPIYRFEGKKIAVHQPEPEVEKLVWLNDRNYRYKDAYGSYEKTLDGVHVVYMTDNERIISPSAGVFSYEWIDHVFSTVCTIAKDKETTTQKTYNLDGTFEETDVYDKHGRFLSRKEIQASEAGVEITTQTADPQNPNTFVMESARLGKGCKYTEYIKLQMEDGKCVSAQSYS